MYCIYNIHAWINVRIIRSINHRNRLYKHLKQMKTDWFDYVIKRLISIDLKIK